MIYLILFTRQDLIKLSNLAGQINNAVANALDSYRRLIRLQTTPSPEALRMFAAFLIDVASGMLYVDPIEHSCLSM